MKILKRLFCKHEFGKVGDIRDFFGIIRCQKCGKWGQKPDEEMVIEHFRLPEIIIEAPRSGT